MYLEERRQAILNLMADHGRVSVPDLSARFDVSEVTIRADLQALAERGLLVRTYGGAISATYNLQELSLLQRRQQYIPEKQRIGAAAAALIADGEAVFLDSSSTAIAVAQHLKTRRDLTLVTNSLVIAQDMLGLTEITVVMPGGTLHHDTVSLIGPDGLAFLEQYHIRKGFFGAYGLSVDAGLTDGSAPESEIKRQLVRLCQTVVVVADAAKWGRVGVTSYAMLSDVNTVITDAQAPPDLVAQVRAAGVKVMLV